MNLSELLTKGLTAEAAVRALAEQVDEDWQTHMDALQGSNDPIANLSSASKINVLAPYRALLLALVDTWDSEDQGAVAPVVPVRSS